MRKGEECGVLPLHGKGIFCSFCFKSALARVQFMIDCFLKFFVGISHFELRILRKVGRRKYIYMRIALSVSEQEKSRLVQIREEEFSGGIPGEFRGKGSILFSSSMILINFSSRE